MRIGTVKPKTYLGSTLLAEELVGTTAITGRSPRHPGVVSPLPGGTVQSALAYDGLSNAVSMTLEADGSITTGYGISGGDFDAVAETRWFTGTPDQAYQAYFEVQSDSSDFRTVGEVWTDIPCGFGANTSGGADKDATAMFRIFLRRKSDNEVVSAMTSGSYALACSTTTQASGPV